MMWIMYIPFVPSIPFLGPRQTVQNQLRRSILQNAVSDQGLLFLLTGISIKNKMKKYTRHP